MTLLATQPCLVLIDRSADLGWLGQFPDFATARAAMADWLAAADRDPEDAAFILPILGFGRTAMEGWTMTQLSDTQAVILSTACAREDGMVFPITANLKGGAVGNVCKSLHKRGLVEVTLRDVGAAPDTLLPSGTICRVANTRYHWPGCLTSLRMPLRMSSRLIWHENSTRRERSSLISLFSRIGRPDE
jgi:hypothetical protein